MCDWFACPLKGSGSHSRRNSKSPSRFVASKTTRPASALIPRHASGGHPSASQKLPTRFSTLLSARTRRSSIHQVFGTSDKSSISRHTGRLSARTKRVQFLFFSAAVSQHTVALICRSRPLDKVHSAATQDSFHKIFSSAASIQLRVARDRSSRPLDKVPRPVTQDACHRISFARGPTRSDQLGAIPKCTSDAVWFAVTFSVNESSVVRL